MKDKSVYRVTVSKYVQFKDANQVAVRVFTNFDHLLKFLVKVREHSTKGKQGAQGSVRVQFRRVTMGSVGKWLDFHIDEYYNIRACRDILGFNEWRNL